ncbi:MAG TPA: VOC family protein [Hypericibacter adhaerens]|jgi:isopenicillin-N N-acyltransferase-like protein|uniref:VOC family protein n=1 Tax=Hypericibacter adhaerens TaxID=2602016 RepID=UPI002B769B44|nr:VOC family protein [Hypericibacter adhaerens]HWA41652.1 VOC family protein [Hypericibacter adhaerens]
MLKLKRIDNMDIVTRDVGRLVDFYHGILGLDFFLPYAPGQSWAAIDLGNLTLYVLKTELGQPAPRRAATGAQNPPGLDSIAFEVEDLDEAMAALEGKVEWVAAQIGTWRHASGTHYRFRAFYDPDGNKLFVTEPHKVPAA